MHKFPFKNIKTQITFVLDMKSQCCENINDLSFIYLLSTLFRNDSDISPGKIQR